MRFFERGVGRRRGSGIFCAGFYFSRASHVIGLGLVRTSVNEIGLGLAMFRTASGVSSRNARENDGDFFAVIRDTGTKLGRESALVSALTTMEDLLMKKKDTMHLTIRLDE